MDSFHVVTFYEITYIDNFKRLGREIERIGTKEKLSGTFFSTPQGVNATLSGSLLGLEKVIHLLNSYDLNIEPTWSVAKKTPFKRLKVKLKEKLLPLDGDFDPVKRRGEHVKPSHWNKLIVDPDTLIIDVRNNYETDIGTFKNSIVPEMDNFIDFPDYVEKNLEVSKNKKIAMFCTGGIRCEIASSYLMSKGFPEVYQLEGGVLNYLDSIDLKDQLWEGECFVFDERVSVNKALEVGNFIQCFGCRRPLTPDEIESEFYKKGVSCRFCYEESSDSDKERFAQRQKQIELAEQRGHQHMGVSAKQTK
ncbi:MAG TPA: rhodanese-related sulfurtransferase [Gammaproteobacteria bacterium]|nr:rhodanese-related sulfurtransferase [Gammaproteobacteria bacterium]HIK72183.1 rhodanese-related sulfurtransferase [Gammaproteobacteria bacterium]